MTYLRMGAEVLFPASSVPAGIRLRVRGPVRPAQVGLIAALGGAATFGKGVTRAWPELLGTATGRGVVNLGAVGAGPEALLGDPALLELATQATAVVLEVPGAIAVGNRFYRVHPRRNDRVVEALAPLRALFPDLDLHDVTFAGALMERLWLCDPQRAAEVVAATQTAWVASMVKLMDRLGPGVRLLWLGDQPPPAAVRLPVSGAAPALVTRAMLEALSPKGAVLVEALVASTRVAMAPVLPGQDLHDIAAQVLAADLPGCLSHGGAASTA
ncbi:MAG: DUF6473 family protein [Alkalilacustris sp.]